MKMQRRRFFKGALSFGVAFMTLFTPSISLGWGAGGHMMVASIAFGRLNPRAKVQVAALLARPITPLEVTNKSNDFVNAAHWADDLRPFPEFDSLKELHFIDQPFSVDGTPPPKLPTPNIVDALKENVEILRSNKDDDAKAKALRLIIHFVGDIHQPLHCATRVDKAHPEGDRGGNLVSLSITTGAGFKKTNLHSYWDGGLGTFPASGPNFSPPSLKSIPAAAARSRIGNPATDSALKLDRPMDFQAWADESFELAKDVVYNGITNEGKPSSAYTVKGVSLARKRVAWAGYRLAALLNSIWP